MTRALAGAAALTLGALITVAAIRAMLYTTGPEVMAYGLTVGIGGVLGLQGMLWLGVPHRGLLVALRWGSVAVGAVLGVAAGGQDKRDEARAALADVTP